MSVNVVNQDGSLTKIAHGFPQSKFDILKSDIANHIETTDMASRDYEAGDVFIMANGHMVRALTDIDEDTTISANDVEDITVTELLEEKANATDLNGKADKVTSATNGNLAGINASGNLTDSNISGDMTTTSATGNPISIPNLKSAQIAKNPIITFEPIQDLHGQSKPYPAGGGKNKFNKDDAASIINGYVSTTIREGNNTRTVFIKCKPNTTYTVSKTAGQRFVIAYTKELPDIGVTVYGSVSGNTASSLTITTSSDAEYVVAYIYNSDNDSGTAEQMIASIQIEEGSSATSYAPYENICPISAYDKIEVLSCGKNLAVDLLPVAGSGGAPTITQNGNQYTFSGTTSGGAFITMPIRANKTYVLSYTVVSGSFGNVRAYSDLSSTTNLGTITPNTAFTFAQDGYVRFWIGSTVTISNLQLEEAESATTYEPPVKTTSISESLGQTVYWFEHDIRSGKPKIKGSDKIDLGSLTWTMYGSGSSAYFDAPHGLSNIKDIGDGFCECYKISQASSVSNMQNGEIRFGSTKIFIKDTTQSSASDLTTALNGKYAVAELATPTEIQLTPHEISLLKDYAYVYTNGTSIAFDYHNGELASLSDVAQLSQIVEELDRPQEKFVEVQINSYNSSSNRYSIPCDGYITATIPSSATANYVRVTVYDCKDKPMGIQQAYGISGGEESFTIFVKKGMKAMVSSSSAYTGVVKFRGMT